MTPQDSFEQVAAEIGSLVAEKNQAYGDSFAKCGDFLRLLWPHGIAPEQYTDALAMVRIFDKQMRIATDKHALGESPYRDIAGYAILGVVKDARETARAAFTPVQDPCAKCATGECNEHKEIAAKLAGTCAERVQETAPKSCQICQHHACGNAGGDGRTLPCPSFTTGATP